MDMADEGLVRDKKVFLALRIAMVVLAMALVAAFFLPWGSATEGFREMAARAPTAWASEEAGITMADATDISLLETARLYKTVDIPGYDIYVGLMYAAVAFPAVAAVTAAAGLPVPTWLLTACTLAVAELLRWDFDDRGVFSGSSHVWGFAPEVYRFAAAALLVVCVAAAVFKHRVKKAEARADEPAPGQVERGAEVQAATPRHFKREG